MVTIDGFPEGGFNIVTEIVHFREYREQRTGEKVWESKWSSSFKMSGRAGRRGFLTPTFTGGHSKTKPLHGPASSL